MFNAPSAVLNRGEMDGNGNGKFGQPLNISLARKPTRRLSAYSLLHVIHNPLNVRSSTLEPVSNVWLVRPCVFQAH